VKPAEVLVRPTGCTFYARRGPRPAASGVPVPGTDSVYSVYRTNRASILDAIDQQSASRNLSQNPVSGLVFASYLAVIGDLSGRPTVRRPCTRTGV